MAQMSETLKGYFSPGDYLRRWVDGSGVSLKHLRWGCIWWESSVDDILDAKARITPRLALCLWELTTIPAAMWINWDRLHLEYQRTRPVVD